MKIYLSITLFLLVSYAYGQGSGKNGNWKRNKHEIFLAVGPTQFLGDLGGLNKIGTQKSLVDLDMPMTRIGGGFGYRFRFHPRFATTTMLYYGLLGGDDAQTNEIIRRSRNLSFRTHLLELSQKIEVILWSNESQGARYHAVSGAANARADFLYAFVGISGFYYNPQTKIDNHWRDLRPLKTEGQGLPDGADEYGLFNFGIPFGLGFKFAVSDFWRLGLEVTYTKTFTDYLDDVSTDYYDPNVLAAEIGPDAAYASNPSIENHAWFEPGQQRGNPDDNDAYFFINFTVTRNITARNKRANSYKWKSRARY